MTAEMIEPRIDAVEEEDTLRVQKRDGRVVDFDRENIVSAVMKAFRDINAEMSAQDIKLINDISTSIESRIRSLYTQRPASISEIQNLVEQGLLDAHLYDVATAYKDYRWKRDIKRREATDVNQAVKKFLHKDKSIMDENANKDANIYSTQRDLLAGAISRAEALRMLPKDVSNAHAKGDIHFHDADYSPFTAETNCGLPNFKDMLEHGFSLGNAQMDSPRSIETAATQITQIMQDVASSQYGGQTLNRADEVLAPYAMMNYAKNFRQAKLVFPDTMDIDAAKAVVASMKAAENGNLHVPDREPIVDVPDEKYAEPIDQQRDLYAKILTRKNIYDAMQTMEYQINSNRVSNGQTPFTTLGFGLGTSWASREVTRCIFLVRILGLGKDHRTAIFPKLTYTIKYGLNSKPGELNYDMKELAIECSTKRMYPDILFYENIVKITGSFKAPMGCRSFLQGWINPETGKDEEDGRNNLGVVTVNIPRIALEAKGNVKKFWRIFDQRMEVAHHALQFRIARAKEATPLNAPSLYQFGAYGRLKPGDSVDKLFNNSRATVSLGYIGLYEAAAAFYGKDWVNDWGWDEDARTFANSIIEKMSALCAEWEKDEGYHYSVYGTPAESLTDKFAKLDLEKFGTVDGITDHEFYTNSFHRPVWIDGDAKGNPGENTESIIERPSFHHANNGGAFSKLDFEQPFLKNTPGGHIVYVEYPSLRQNPKALEAVWDYAHEVGIDYLGSNSPIDHCFTCGYEGDFEPTSEGYKCPECGEDRPDHVDVTKRTCGYLGNPVARPMAHGRHEELAHRRKHMEGKTGQVTLSSGDEKEFYEDRAFDIHTF